MEAGRKTISRERNNYQWEGRGNREMKGKWTVSRGGGNEGDISKRWRNVKRKEKMKEKRKKGSMVRG